MKYTFPTELYGQNVVLMQIDAALLPIVSGKLKNLLSEHIWIDADSYELGYNAIAEMLSMRNNIEKAIDRLYRLIDTSMNGVIYEESYGVITPDIPVVPPTIEVGLRQQLLDAQGTLPGEWFEFGGKSATTADVVRAMRADSPDEIERVTETFDALQELAQGATVFSVVEDFITDGADLSVEGLLLTTTIIATMAQAAMMGVQRVQLDRIIATLDGGAIPRPDGTILESLASIDESLG